jgi:hypothetical protein
VFGCTGSATNDIIIAAIRRAAVDGNHIINFSLGSGPNFRDHPLAITVDLVSKMGHLVFGSSGNDGVKGLYSSGGPATASVGFGVGSADNSEQPSAFLSVGQHDYSITFGGSSPAFAPASDISNIVINDIYAETNNTMNDGMSTVCNPAISGFPSLIRWGH